MVAGMVRSLIRGARIRRWRKLVDILWNADDVKILRDGHAGEPFTVHATVMGERVTFRLEGDYGATSAGRSS